MSRFIDPIPDHDQSRLVLGWMIVAKRAASMFAKRPPPCVTATMLEVHHSARGGRMHAVKVNGRRYPSIAQASALTGLPVSSIRRAMGRTER
jgi:hypothetical protein